MRIRPHPATGDVYRITSAPRSPAEDLNRRMSRYLFSMSVRTVCFALAFFVPVVWLKVVFVLAAITLPYVAVVMANAGRELAEPPPPTLKLDAERQRLGSAAPPEE